MMFNFFKFLILFFCISANVFANGIYKVQKKDVLIFYTIKKGDRFSGIIKKFVKADSIINKKTPMVKKTLKSNPKVKNWRRLQPGTEIKLFVDKKLIDKKKFKAYVASMKNKRPTGFRANIFYMASAGSFTQYSEAANIDIKFNQNSPITLGLASLYFFKNTNLSLSNSVYYSTLSPAQTPTGGTLEIPSEIGVTSHLQYFIQKAKMDVYLGPEFELFSTFNTGAYSNNANVIVDQNAVVFLTFGFSKLFKVWSQFLFTKLSYSLSLSNTTTINPDGGVEIETPYSGSKILLYLNLSLGKKWFIHTLAKYHTMSGPDDLTVLRIGAGFGYKF